PLGSLFDQGRSCAGERGKLGPFEKMDAARVRVARTPYLFAGEDQHRCCIANEGMEEDVEDGPIGCALQGLRARRGVDVAVETVLADVEIEGGQILVAEIGEETRVGVEVEIIDRLRQFRVEIGEKCE